MRLILRSELVERLRFMDTARGLLTKLIDEDRLNEVNRSGITDDFIDDDECKSVYSFIQRHYTEYRACPSRTAVKQVFPNFDFVNYKEPLEYFIEQLKESFRRNVLEEALLEAHRSYQSDTKTTESVLRDVLGRLSVTQRSFKDVDLAGMADQRFETYLERKRNPGADGVLSGWPRIDYYTLGWHTEEFIVLVGEKHKGKSWLMLWLAYQAMLQGERVLFITKEMSQDALTRRFDSIFASIKFDSLRRGELSTVEEQRYKEKLDELAASSHKISLSRHGVNTIEEIEQKAIELDSTIVFVDSVYLFNPDHRSNYSGETIRRAAVSKRCKEAATNLGIPWIVSTQAGRKKSKNDGPSLDSIEWSNAFAQDADAVMVIEKDDIDRELGQLWIHLLKSRDGDITAACIRTDFEYMKFTQNENQVEPSLDIDIDEEEEGLF